jgi:hypothetical protein
MKIADMLRDIKWLLLLVQVFLVALE